MPGCPFLDGFAPLALLTAPQFVDGPARWAAGAPAGPDGLGTDAPPPLDQEQQYARMFELSHIYGPFIGLLLCSGLAASGFPLDYRLGGFAFLVAAFWLYPPLLRKTRRYRLLSLCSLHHLMFVILWASHGYGGLMSPFLLWFAVVPLLGFLYLPPRVGLWAGLVLSLAASMAIFMTVSLWFLPPPAVPAGMLQPMALLSIIGASAYVAMMAVYLGRVLDSRRELQRQADGHREAAASLTKVAGETCRSSDEKLTMIRRLAKGSAGPLDDMRGNSAALVSDGQNEGDGQELASITEAVGCLQALIADIDRYAQVDGPGAEPKPAPVDVLALLEEAAERVRPQMAGRAGVFVRADSAEAGRVEADKTLLADAIVYASRHLVLGAQGRGLVLHAERMGAGGVQHLVIDIALESAEDLAAPAVTTFDSQTLKRPSSGQHPGGSGLSLALADRICALLGGSLLADGQPAESARFRIVVPVAGDSGQARDAA